MPTQISPARVAELLTRSPGWARVALTAGDQQLREAATETLALLIAERHDEPSPCYDKAQLALPLA